MKHEKSVKNFARAGKVLFIGAVLMVVCAMAVAEGGSAENAGATSISLSVTPGPQWQTTMWAGPIPVKKTPQFAAWIETADGKFVKTLAVTSRAGKKTWRSASSGGRPEALPVWSHVAGADSAIDATSSATPKGSVSVSSSSAGLSAGTEYVARFEVNTSFDYNDDWPKGAKSGEKGYSGVNGQPSVVYECRFVAGVSGSYVLQPVAQGAVDGSSGFATPGLAGLTTALSIVDKAVIEIR